MVDSCLQKFTDEPLVFKPYPCYPSYMVTVKAQLLQCSVAVQCSPACGMCYSGYHQSTLTTSFPFHAPFTAIHAPALQLISTIILPIAKPTPPHSPDSPYSKHQRLSLSFLINCFIPRHQFITLHSTARGIDCANAMLPLRMRDLAPNH